jgi:hypothetical protein
MNKKKLTPQFPARQLEKNLYTKQYTKRENSKSLKIAILMHKPAQQGQINITIQSQIHPIQHQPTKTDTNPDS